MKDPIQNLISQAENLVRNIDPSWDHAQPPAFKERVIEAWKQTIHSELVHNSLIVWNLSLGNVILECYSPIFCLIDWEYNPYSLASTNARPSKISQ